MNILDKFANGLIVSCQAEDNGPLDDPIILSALAKSAEIGGAVGIRANLPRNISKIKKEVNLPVIGIYKKKYDCSSVYITPTFDEAKEVIDSGADMIAIDGTMRERPMESLSVQIKKIRDYSNIPILADIATFEEAQNAYKLGVEAVATTLLSYTKKTRDDPAPDFSLIQDISKKISIPLFVEGNIRSPEQASKAISSGAHTVVVGTAITSISWITNQYVNAINKAQS